MKRYNLYIDETTLEHLENLPGTVSEHIRQAIYDYLLKLHNVSASLSKKGGQDEQSIKS